jgi:hypothetical protein
MNEWTNERTFQRNNSNDKQRNYDPISFGCQYTHLVNPYFYFYLINEAFKNSLKNEFCRKSGGKKAGEEED